MKTTILIIGLIIHSFGIKGAIAHLSIDAKGNTASAYARDILQAARGNYDYRFTPTNQITTKASGKARSLAESSLEVYPNPASNELTLNIINSATENALISIYDAMGQLILQQTVGLKAGKVRIDISSFSNGLYHVQLYGADHISLNQSFIKQ